MLVFQSSSVDIDAYSVTEEHRVRSPYQVTTLVRKAHYRYHATEIRSFLPLQVSHPKNVLHVQSSIQSCTWNDTPKGNAGKAPYSSFSRPSSWKAKKLGE